MTLSHKYTHYLLISLTSRMTNSIIWERLNAQVPKVPLVPKLNHSGDSRHFDAYEELPPSAFDPRPEDVDVAGDFDEF